MAARPLPMTAANSARPPRAIIGVSTSEMRTPERVVHDPHSEPVQSIELALGLTYPEAIRRAGAVPVIIPPLDTDSIEPLLDSLCGLCLSGGPDLHPTVYGAAPHAALGPTEPHLDLFEIALVRAAEARDLPVLAICRGLQVLNVARGGTLLQDLPMQRPSTVVHRQQPPGTVATHGVTLDGDSVVANALGLVDLRVNSFHPGGRRPRKRTASGRLGERRGRRGDRGHRPRLHGRGAVACREHGRNARAGAPAARVRRGREGLRDRSGACRLRPLGAGRPRRGRSGATATSTRSASRRRSCCWTRATGRWRLRSTTC